MQTRSDNGKFAVEPLEGRRMMSATASGDFNGDGRIDRAVVTSPTTITVSLLNADNVSYTVSAILTSSKSRTFTDVFVGDSNGDGKLDVFAGSGSGGPKFSSNVWLGNGDGTFDSGTTGKFRWPHVGHGGIW